MLQPVDLNLINDLWVPNVFIYNLKTFKVKGEKQILQNVAKAQSFGIENNVRYTFSSHFEAS